MKEPKDFRILIACEESQVVCKAFRARGFEAYSCDLQESSGGHPEWHIKGDVTEILKQDWHLVIGHPTCTFICNSGVRWLFTEPGRFDNLQLACDFFNLFKELKCPVAIENPIPHKYAVEKIGKYQQLIQPWQFGETTSKATCLWLLNGLPKLEATKIIPKEERTFEIHKMAPGPERTKLRSKTFQGIADAMAQQWGDYLLTQQANNQ